MNFLNISSMNLNFGAQIGAQNAQNAFRPKFKLQSEQSHHLDIQLRKKGTKNPMKIIFR